MLIHVRATGEEFSVDPEQYTLFREPKQGDIVTFSHDHQSRRAIPTNVNVHQIRLDMTWEDIATASNQQFNNSM